MNSQIYILKYNEEMLQEYNSLKYKELQQIENEIKIMRTNNGQIFMGGYTEPAKRSYDFQEAQISRIEKEKLDAHSKKWDEFNKLIEQKKIDYFKKLDEEKERKHRETIDFVTMKNTAENKNLNYIIEKIEVPTCTQSKKIRRVSFIKEKKE